ncbi:MAG: penicillin-binding transpeptidase domain-containing protein, partial [Oscillospiraceae bacterium]
MDDSKYTRVRLYGLMGFTVVALGLFIALLVNTQIVHGEAYLEQSVRTITERARVEASRGILTDRNGKPLVSNRLSYTLTFDSSLLVDGDDENAAILRLIDLCQQRGVRWVDNLPVTIAPPFAYHDLSGGGTQLSRFLTYLQDRKWVSASLKPADLTATYLASNGLTATTLIAKMRADFQLSPDLSDGDARKILGVQYELAVRKLVNTTAYIFAEDVDAELISLLADGNYLGVRVGASSVREYETPYAAHILGSVGRIYEEEYAALKEKGYAMDDLVGKDGVEAAFEDYLRGTDGTRVVSSNSDGKVTSELYTKEPKPGDTVALTMDLSLQQAVEEALAETVSGMTRTDGISRGAGAAVIAVDSGDVLALASYPTYDLTSYRQDYAALNADPRKPMFNRATQGTYAPGSTFKPCTAVAALETGKITPKTEIRDLGRYTYYAPTYQPKCWSSVSHGLVNVSEAITVSCNYFFYEVGRITGIAAIDQYAAAFGLGQKTGIEIAEQTGVLAGPAYAESVGEVWYDGQTIAAAIGQSYNLFTPLQLANYIATLVNGGDHYDAHLLKAVKTYDNSSVVYAASPTPQNHIDISDSTLTAVKTGMHNLVTSGSIAPYFKSCVVDAGAKTGTAQITKNVKNNGVFVCFAPYDDPQIALSIVIEKGGSGGALASTAVKILNAYFTQE